jgi:hypothetical protein
MFPSLPRKLAGSCFQTASVKDRELAATVADQLALAPRAGGSSKRLRGVRPACRPGIMRDVELTGVGAIASHQEPTGKPRLRGPLGVEIFVFGKRILCAVAS